MGEFSKGTLRRFNTGNRRISFSKLEGGSYWAEQAEPEKSAS
jgi:hypothetical protein